MAKRASHYAGYAHDPEIVPGVFVSTEDQAVYIVDDRGEVACWNSDEWAEDPEAAIATINAVILAAVKGAAAVRENIKLKGHTLKQLIHETAGRVATENR